MSDPAVLAKELSLKAEHYASAFRTAAHVVKSRTKASSALDTVTGEVMSQYLIDKARAEEEFKVQLDMDPIGTLTREGLI